MITKIGIIAGEIWCHLEGKGRVDKISNMVQEIQKDRDLILMGIGWLAREGHVTLEGEAPEYIDLYHGFPPWRSQGACQLLKMTIGKVEEPQPILLGKVVFSGADVIADGAQHRLTDRGHRLGCQPIAAHRRQHSRLEAFPDTSPTNSAVT